MKKYIYDNSNLAESYSGITTPLTFSFARYVYQEVYKHFCGMMGVGAKTISENGEMYRSMVEFIGYRMYYNLINWYKLVSFLPGYKFNRGFFEKMLGVEKEYNYQSEKEDGFFNKYFILFPRLIYQFLKVSFTFIFMGFFVKAFNQKFDKIYKEALKKNLETLNFEDLRALYLHLVQKLISKWRVPIANDFAVMVSVGVTEKIFKKYLKDDNAYVHLYLKSQASLSSLDPGMKILEISKVINSDSEILNLFKNESDSLKLYNLLIDKYPEHDVSKLIETYSEEFGSRSPNELKLESESINESPELLIEVLRNSLDREISDAPNKEEQIIKGFNKLSFFKKRLVNFFLRWSRNSIRRREETRLKRSLIFGLARKVFLLIGKIFEKKGVLNKQRDIFYLKIEEIFLYSEKLDNFNFKNLVEERKIELNKWAKVETPRRIESDDKIKKIEKDLLNQVKINKQESGVVKIKGMIAANANKAVLKGEVLVLKEFNPNANFNGKILVTKQTDPGWTIVFPMLKGLIVERGGMLSHAAIVARELNIPCVIGVNNATDLIQDKANIVINLKNGEINV